MSSFDALLLRARRMAQRSRAAAACVSCKESKARCSDYRPCARCKRAGIICKDFRFPVSLFHSIQAIETHTVPIIRTSADQASPGYMDAVHGSAAPALQERKPAAWNHHHGIGGGNGHHGGGGAACWVGGEETDPRRSSEDQQQVCGYDKGRHNAQLTNLLLLLEPRGEQSGGRWTDDLSAMWLCDEWALT